MRIVKINNIKIGAKNPLCLIAGPCVIEGEEIVLRIATKIKKITEKLNMPFIFKSSYKKDNRSSAESYQGPGLEKGLKILEKVKKKLDVPVLSDVHGIEEVDVAAEVLDVIQIPAYLSMQTSLTLKVGKTGKPVNVKKGQFLHPLDMKNVIGKLEFTGNYNILLTERGSCFGYRQLVADMKSLPMMRSLGYPVVLDSTHIIRNYGISSSAPAGGSPEYIPHISRAGVAAGCDAIFIETHDNLCEALCDASSMLPLEKLKDLLAQLIEIDHIVRGNI
ncbi:3-deoxy-8-phosphooctulonate synthase [candidate division KSB1 bacterium]|nr:MAG: 3-deoxy-8-phosphooctulonate synthase [candidate division KSB1 bacterium]